MKYQLADILALLTPDMVIAACGIDARRRGRAWRIRTCPGCGDKPSREGAAIYYRKSDGTPRWTHHGHECGGDMLDLIAAAERIDRRRELPKLLEVSAKIAGVEANDPELERKIAERVRQENERRAREEAERTAAIAAMPSTWAALERRSLVGERYLLSRGLDPAELRAQGDVIRYSAAGELALPMRSLSDGAIVGIQYRSADTAKQFRTAPYSDADESALCGRPSDIDPDGVDVAVIVEGLGDTLAGRLAFPGCAVYGAAGAGQLAGIVERIAPRVLAARGWLLLVPHDDEPGVDAGVEAVRAAQSAGLVLDRDLHLVDLGEHNDLADAWRAGWRWQWPQLREENGR